MVDMQTQTEQLQLTSSKKRVPKTYARGLGMGRAATRSMNPDHMVMMSYPQLVSTRVQNDAGEVTILSSAEVVHTMNEGGYVTEVEVEADEGCFFVDVQRGEQTMTGAGVDMQTLTGDGNDLQTMTGAGVEVQTSTDHDANVQTMTGADTGVQTIVRAAFAMKPVPMITLNGPQGQYEMPNPSTVEQAKRTPQAAQWDNCLLYTSPSPRDAHES
eukprot:7380517-Prymnesium_polylepis.1